LQAVIREPFNHPPVQLVAERFKLSNKMTEAVLYLDGPYLQVPVGFGDTVTFKVSKEPLMLAK